MSTCARAIFKGGPGLVAPGCYAGVHRAVVAVLMLVLAGTAQAAPPGAVISNQAAFDYQNAVGQTTTILSNEVSVTTAVVRSPATVEFTRVQTNGSGSYQETVGPSACLQSGAFTVLPDPVILGGNAIDPSVAVSLSVASSFNTGETVFIRLQDSDQNLDYQLIEYVEVTLSNADSGDSETLRLTETGPNTGVFAGYIQTAGGAVVAGDCLLQGASKSMIDVSYIDPADPTDTTETQAQIDPTQRVFESVSGGLVDGTIVEIVDASTGLPAVVYGNDGVSQFPSSITSGGSTTDSSGTVYVFGPGEFRFPVVPDGNYRLLVTPPANYVAPSQVPESELQLLPGAPWDLAPASFGVAFSKAGGVTTGFDIPLDPQASDLFLQKRTQTTMAAPGDFVRYELLLENSSIVGNANSTRIIDQLPRGVRFVSGSVNYNGAAVPDPIIDAARNTLTFEVGVLAPGERAQIYYVVEIIGGKRNQELVNSAMAEAAGGLLSNESKVAIRLTEDLFRSTGTIIGRVLEASCGQETYGEDQGVANIRVYLEDGRFAVTDAGGRYHFEGIESGTHVAQLDTFTVPDYFDVIGCSDTPGYAGRAHSQFVKLSRGGMHRADFYLKRKPAPEGRIELEMRNSAADSSDRVKYELEVDGVGNVNIDNINLMVLLPEGVSYEAGSLQIGGRHLGEPRMMGPAMTLALDSEYGNWNKQVSFVAVIDEEAQGELTSKATATFDTPIAKRQKTPLAETKMLREPGTVENAGYVLDLKFSVLSDELSATDKQQLDRLIENWCGIADIHLSAIGHSDSQKISARNRHLFADNYALSNARATSVAMYISRALAIPEGNIQVAGRGADDPIADNATAEGRRQNRRVEMVMSGVRPSKPSFLEVTKATSGTMETATKGAVPGTEIKQTQGRDESLIGMPASQKIPPIDSLQPGYKLLLPVKGYAPAIPSSKVAVQHEPGQTVELTLNDQPVSKLNFEGVTLNKAGTVAVSRWQGVDLVDGANKIRAVIRNEDGSKAKGIRRTIHFAGMPIRAEYVAEKSTLIADGKTKPVVALRLYDRSGKPSRAGLVGNYRVNPPYRSAWDEQQDRKNALVTVGERSAGYRTGEDGIALLELAPTTLSGEVTVVLPFEHHHEQEVRAWLSPAQRDWILVGFGEGTAGYNTIDDNAVAAAEAGHEDGYYDEGRIAFFAKGSIKGEYLLTLAYDSDRDRDQARERFDTQIDPNAYYTLYGDTSEQRFDAASQRNIYVKIERRQFYALFGDFDTGLSVTELTRYQRRFNGVKSEYRGENFGYSVFAAETDQSFNRDEIAGDGTSGLYQLSNAPIIANSEVIRIETRDRFDSGVVLSSRTLTRFLDYNLDTLSGALYFKQPVQSRDLDFNPIVIVAEYESVAAGTDDIVAGGRGSVRLADDAVEIGVTHINDASQGAEADMSGVDLRWQINPQTLLKAEAADSNATVGGVKQSGSAQRIEIEHNGEKIDARAFVSEVEDGFGMGYQSEAEKGVRRLGANVRAEVNDNLTLEGEAGWQQNLQTKAIRNLARGALRYERGDFSGRLGVSHAEDKFEDDETLTSNLAELSLAQRILDGKVQLRASGSTSLGGEAESADFPTQILLGADYRIVNGVDLVLEYEQAEGRDLDTETTRLGVRATPWNRAQLNGFLNNEVSEFGPRVFANVGLVQGFQLTERWVLDIGVDHGDTLSGSGLRQFDDDRVLSSGSVNEDFTAVYTGAMYNAELWSANMRVEHRNSDSEERQSVLFGWYRQPDLGHGLSAGLTAYTVDNVLGNELESANLRFGWAYRLADRKWSFLDRIDLIYDRALTGAEEQKSWRFVNNFNANRRISAAAQLSLQYASKYVRTEFDGQGFTGYTDLIGADFRYGFRPRWDVGLSTSIYHSWKSDVFDFGAGIDVGFNIAENMWLSLGYNFEGFEDRDFQQARYTAAGPFLRFSIKADQLSLKRIAGR